MKQLKIFQIHINFAMAILINLLCCQEKVFIHMNKCIAGKNLMKLNYLIENPFTANQMKKVLAMQTMSILKKYGKC